MRVPKAVLGMPCLLGIGSGVAMAQTLELPGGASTAWIVEGPSELVEWRTFDPVEVAHLLPEGIRFETIEEVASRQIEWAVEYLAGHPEHEDWGISFLEIVAAETFTIDGRSPDWPVDGAAGLWFARVTSADDLGPGVPFLVLELWVPDQAFVNYMRGLGHYATFGRVRLARPEPGMWRGSITIDDLTVFATCRSEGQGGGTSNSVGAQVFVPPQTSGIAEIVRVAFAGHETRNCAARDEWSIAGTHPLSGSRRIAPPTLQFGYRLVGGAYIR